MNELATAVLAEYKRVFSQYKELADNAIRQLSDEQLHYSPDEESNSVALIMKHMGGNMRSRWTEFLTSDGEKPDRNRDAEFETTGRESRQEVTDWWEKGWSALFGTLESLQPEDLLKSVTIRGEKTPVVQALSRQEAHYSYHVGQIAYVGKMIRGAEWKTLSIARNKSNEYNEKLKFG